MRTTLQTRWQTTLETGVETGEMPLLDLGWSAGILPGLMPLLALTDFAHERLDMTAPTVLVGGDSSSWLVALLATPHTAPPLQAPGITIAYGGADQATHMASVGIYQSRSLHRPEQTQELPRAYAAWFAPSEHAGATAWAAWPFGLWAEVSRGQVGDRWLTWAGLLLAIGLLITGLFV